MKSWVWEHFKKSEDGSYATCEICDQILKTYGSTTTLNDHLTKVHQICRPSTVSKKRQHKEAERLLENDSECCENLNNSIDSLTEYNFQNDDFLNTPKKRARRASARSKSAILSKERSEIITQSIAKLISVNKLPFSIVSSSGFQEFMKVLEPNYNCPCSETILCRLRIIEEQIKRKIENQLDECSYVALDTDCWTSRSQEGYMNINAHIIDNEWKAHTFTLCTNELDERHTAENLADALLIVTTQFNIDNKLVAITNDSASNIVLAVNLLPFVDNDVTCAAHKLHLVVQNALKKGSVCNVLNKASKIVTHFRHSVIASKSLEKKQEQLGLPKLKLVQNVCTRWNTTLSMAERLVENRSAILNVLTDKSVTNHKQILSLEMLEKDWTVLEILVDILKPFKVATSLLSAGLLSAVKPIMHGIINNHLTPAISKYKEENLIIPVIEQLTLELARRFNLEWKTQNIVEVSGKASFLDPRFKQMLFETEQYRMHIREEIERELIALNAVESTAIEVKKASGYDFIFKRAESGQLTAAVQQLNMYKAEAEIDMNMDPLEWWQSHKNKFPLVAQLAKKYLCIPASSVASERVFSTTGNIVTSKRNCLNSENVATATFLYQNRNYL